MDGEPPRSSATEPAGPSRTRHFKPRIRVKVLGCLSRLVGARLHRRTGAACEACPPRFRATDCYIDNVLVAEGSESGATECHTTKPADRVGRVTHEREECRQHRPQTHDATDSPILKGPDNRHFSVAGD